MKNEDDLLPVHHRRGQRPPGPTHALPGSEQKIKVMRERAKEGYSLFHPDDAVPDEVMALLILYRRSDK